jgi:voltage-gated potassium channel Kch
MRVLLGDTSGSVVTAEAGVEARARVVVLTTRLRVAGSGVRVLAISDYTWFSGQNQLTPPETPRP